METDFHLIDDAVIKPHEFLLTIIGDHPLRSDLAVPGGNVTLFRETMREFRDHLRESLNG